MSAHKRLPHILFSAYRYPVRWFRRGQARQREASWQQELSHTTTQNSTQHQSKLSCNQGWLCCAASLLRYVSMSLVFPQDDLLMTLSCLKMGLLIHKRYLSYDILIQKVMWGFWSIASNIFIFFFLLTWIHQMPELHIISTLVVQVLNFT